MRYNDGPMDGILYASLCLIWGSTWAAIKYALDGVPPFLGAGLRFALASLVLTPFALKRRKPLTRDDRLAIVSCGFLSFTLSYATVYWAEQYIASGLTAILYCTMPLFVALLSAFWTKAERLTARKVAGIVIGMAGTAVLFWPHGDLGASQASGMLATLAGSFSAAANLVTMKKHSKHTDIFVLNASAMAIGAACLLTLSAATESYAGLHWTRSNAAALVYLSLIGSVASFLSYYHLIKTMEATLLSMITLIIPIVAVGLGWLFLGETVGASTGLGILIVLGGVAIAIAPSGKAKTAAVAAALLLALLCPRAGAESIITAVGVRGGALVTSGDMRRYLNSGPAVVEGFATLRGKGKLDYEVAIAGYTASSAEGGLVTCAGCATPTTTYRYEQTLTVIPVVATAEYGTVKKHGSVKFGLGAGAYITTLDKTLSFADARAQSSLGQHQTISRITGGPHAQMKVGYQFSPRVGAEALLRYGYVRLNENLFSGFQGAAAAPATADFAFSAKAGNIYGLLIAGGLSIKL
jgi:drug/metabolite transporter (DMT)-like permease